MTELHVIFGTGPLGRYTAELLLVLGKSVRMVNRSGKMVDAPARVEILASDAYDVTRNLKVTRGAAAVYQCAQPHYHQWQEKFPPLQRAILQAVSQNGAKLVVGDNLYMYGKFSGNLSEDFPVNPHTKKGKVRAAMAQEILDAHAAGKERFWHIARHTRHARTSLRANMVYPQAPISQAEFVRLMEAELGKPVKSQVAGALLMRILGLFNKAMAETVEMMYE